MVGGDINLRIFIMQIGSLTQITAFKKINSPCLSNLI